MPSLLEAYLDQVAAHLSALPTKRRNEELREMRQHLQNAVTVNQELGQSEEDAVQNAVMQFGTAEDLGGNLVWAWRREEKLNKRSFWGAAIFSLAFLLFTPVLLQPLIVPHLSPLGLTHFSTTQWFLWIVGVRLAGPILAGVTTSFIFSRRAPFAGVYGPALYLVLSIPASFHQLDNIASLCIQNGLVILVISWAASRVRLAWNKRKPMIQA